MNVIPEYPQSDNEKWIAKIAGISGIEPEPPDSRIEKLLAYLSERITYRNSYGSVVRRGPYLFDVSFISIPEEIGLDSVISGCSTYVQDGKMVRNLDWDYSDLASFHVQCPTFEGMAFLPGLTNSKLDDILIGQLPYHVVDGVNENGIMVSMHVLFNDWDWQGVEEGIPLYLVPYHVLTKVKSMATIETDLGDILPNLCTSPTLDENDYLLQFVVSDGTTTCAILPPETSDGIYTVVDISSNPKLTNFRWVSDATVARGDLQERPTGVERWNIMPCDAKDLRFTKCYESADRLSEFIGIDGTTKDSTDEELMAIYSRGHELYESRERDGSTWQTMHSVVYSPKGMEYLWIQENWNKDYGVGAIQDRMDDLLLKIEYIASEAGIVLP